MVYVCLRFVVGVQLYSMNLAFLVRSILDFWRKRNTMIQMSHLISPFGNLEYDDEWRLFPVINLSSPLCVRLTMSVIRKSFFLIYNYSKSKGPGSPCDAVSWNMAEATNFALKGFLAGSFL
jgi:hypothetical protein